MASVPDDRVGAHAVTAGPRSLGPSSRMRIEEFRAHPEPGLRILVAPDPCTSNRKSPWPPKRPGRFLRYSTHDLPPNQVGPSR